MKPENVKWYYMEMEFNVTRMICNISCSSSIVIKQTLPMIPDDDYIKKVSDVIMHTLSDEIGKCTACEFSGYRTLKCVN